MNKPMRAAAIQMATGPSVDSNLIEAQRLIQDAAEMGAGLVVLPENFALMGKKDQELLGIAEPPGSGPLQEFLSGIADRLGIWLVGGTIPLQASVPDRVRSAALVFDASGQQVARYDKMHLFDVSLPDTEERYHESATMEPGDSLAVLDTPLGRLGVAVCYDLRFPELFRQMQDHGVEILAIPSAFTALTGKAHWEVLVRARAIENLAYVVAAAQGGYHLNGRETHGHSMIVDPWGAILAQVPRGSGCICCPIDLDFQKSVRRSFPVLEHRRLKCRLAADI